MATTCKLIAKNVLGSDAADVTFSSIPQTGYTDLLLVASARTARNLDMDQLRLEFNGSTSNYSLRYLDGASGGTTSGTLNEMAWLTACGNTATANTFGSAEAYIPNYAGSTNKSASSSGVSENNATAATISVVASLWSDTSAITSIKIVSRVGSNIRSGSSFFLYGITKA